jgi:hypothetical protein
LRSHLRARPALLIILAIVGLYAGVAGWRRAHRPAGFWIARTHCSWGGEPRVEFIAGLRAADSITAAAHESVHVAECKALGPARYRWNTAFAASNLALEAPAYCSSARSRLKSGWSLGTTRATTLEDMLAGMGDQLDSATLHRALTSHCPELR